MTKPKKISIGTYTPRDPMLLCDEDVRWMEIVRRSVDGLAAFAEAHAEGCEQVWMGLDGLLNDLKDTIETIIDDFKERLKEEKKS